MGLAEGRKRRKTKKDRRDAVAQTARSSHLLEFVNPYPWMSSIEAMVHIELERRKVPFSWRFFDGDAPHLKTLMPDFAPEFTLREYRVVILILGNFFGSLQRVLDKNSLAQVLLEADGWKVVALFEDDIRQLGASRLLDREVPALIQPTVLGAPRPNPFGIPDFMARRRATLRGVGLVRAKFQTIGKDATSDRGNPHSRRRRFGFGNLGDRARRRRQQAG